MFTQIKTLINVNGGVCQVGNIEHILIKITHITTHYYYYYYYYYYY